MGQGLTTARGIIGGFCAAFLVYVVVGGAVAIAVAGPYNADENCWPHYTVLGIIRTECAHPIADAVWRATVETAHYFIVIPTLSLVQLVQVVRTGSTHWLGEAIAWGTAAVPILIASAIGFLHLRGRTAPVAWGLLVLFVALIAYGVAPHVTRDLVEPMVFLFPALRRANQDHGNVVGSVSLQGERYEGVGGGVQVGHARGVGQFTVPDQVR
jgi:hypothetical protein